MNMPKNGIIDVTCAVIIYKNKILAVQRSNQMKLPLKWEFPGGKIEKDENEETCIKREIEEEINIKIAIIKKLTDNVHDYGDHKIRLIPFLAKHIEGEIKLMEHKAYKLVNIINLPNLDWAEADIPIVNEVLKLKL